MSSGPAASRTRQRQETSRRRRGFASGATRSNDFLRRGLATNVLTTCLDGFVGAGIMERRASTRLSGQSEYVPTRKRRELAPVIIDLPDEVGARPAPGIPAPIGARMR